MSDDEKTPTQTMAEAGVDEKLMAAFTKVAQAASAGDAKTAIELVEKLLDDKRAELGEKNPDMAQVLAVSSVLYEKVGEPDRAFAMRMDAIRVLRAARGDGHAEMATLLVGMAEPLGSTGMRQFRKAAPLYEKAERIQAGLSDGDPLELALTRASLALEYCNLRKVARAAELADQAALEAMKEGHKPGKLAAKVLHRAAWARATLDIRHEDPRTMLRASLRILDEAGAPDSLEAAKAHNLLGSLHKASGETDLALSSFTKARDVFAKLEGAAGVEAVGALVDVGTVRVMQQKNGEALEAFAEALRLCEEGSVPDSAPWMPQLLHNAALLYQRAGEHDKAMPLFDRAAGLYERRRNMRQLGALLVAWSDGLEARGMLDDALRASYKGLQVCAAGYGKKHDSVKRCMLAQFRICRKMGDEEKLRAVVENYKRVTGESAAEIAKLEMQLHQQRQKEEQLEKKRAKKRAQKKKSKQKQKEAAAAAAAAAGSEE